MRSTTPRLDPVRDTILEFTAGGVHLIDDYREDVEGYING